MTKKHFIEIANILNANRTPLETVSDFADYFEDINERFNRQAFVEASTVHMRADLNHRIRQLREVESVV